MKTKLTIITLALTAAMPAVAADSLLGAVAEGKTSLDTRTRFEYVTDDSKPLEDTGYALTNRLVLGFRTAEYNGFTAGIEFENVTALIDDDKYNSAPPAGAPGAGNGNSSYPSIGDPYLTQVNQAWIDFKGLKYGRQKLVFDNARFIGDVGWRQNDQTFDGLVYANKTLIPKTQFTLAWLTGVNNIFGISRDVKAPLLNIKVSPSATTNLTGFYYAIEEEAAPAASWAHTGLRVDGSLGSFLYDLSFASQGDYADGTTVDADYTDVQLGYKFGDITVRAQYEVLEPGFKTPLATLHAWNGWADRFLNTPAAGLQDINLKLLMPVMGNNLVVGLHQFSADDGDQDFGTELDVSLARKFSDKCNGMIKFASYMAEDDAPGALGKDVNKLWLQVQYKFM